jgi:Glycine-zipper domain
MRNTHENRAANPPPAGDLVRAIRTGRMSYPMRRLLRLNSKPNLIACLAAVTLPLAGCATAPRQMSPTVMALPAPGEGFVLFQQHDAVCRQFAAERSSRAVGLIAARGAAAGAGVGAAAGALIGTASGRAGGGAAIGAGVGLVAGLLHGSARAGARAAATQRAYDMSYTQCMVANGERIQPPVVAARVIYAPPPRALVIYPAPYPQPPAP